MSDTTPLLEIRNNPCDPALIALIRKAASVPQWTEDEALAMATDPTHLETMQMIDYLHKKVTPAEKMAIQAHLSQCDYCLSELTEFADFVLSEPARNFSLVRLAQTVASLLEPLILGKMAWQHAAADSTPETQRHTLAFDDPQLRGSFADGGKYFDLRIEHDSWRAGTLAALEVEAPNEGTCFFQFYVFQEGWERASIETLVEGVNFDHCLLRVHQIETAQLIAEDMEPLQRAFKSSLAADPETLEAWQLWAKSALAEAQDQSIKLFAEQIIAWQT